MPKKKFVMRKAFKATNGTTTVRLRTNTDVSKFPEGGAAWLESHIQRKLDQLARDVEELLSNEDVPAFEPWAEENDLVGSLVNPTPNPDSEPLDLDLLFVRRK